MKIHKNIHNDLIKAYEGYYDDSLKKELEYEGYKDVEEMIRAHSPKKRLEVYLEWNGILGWTGRIWDISQGEFES